jgi:hypothetical protein
MATKTMIMKIWEFDETSGAFKISAKFSDDERQIETIQPLMFEIGVHVSKVHANNDNIAQVLAGSVWSNLLMEESIKQSREAAMTKASAMRTLGGQTFTFTEAEAAEFTGDWVANTAG